jgi:hypothetical protein
MYKMISGYHELHRRLKMYDTISFAKQAQQNSRGEAVVDGMKQNAVTFRAF